MNIKSLACKSYHLTMSVWFEIVKDSMDKIFSDEFCWFNNERFHYLNGILAEFETNSFDVEVQETDKNGVIKVALKFSDKTKGDYHLTCGVVPPEVWPVDNEGNLHDCAIGHFKLFVSGKMYEAFIFRENYQFSTPDVFYNVMLTIPVTEFFSIVEQVKTRINM